MNNSQRMPDRVKLQDLTAHKQPKGKGVIKVHLATGGGVGTVHWATLRLGYY